MVVVVVTQVLTPSAQLWTQLIYLPPSHWHFGTCTGRSDKLSCSQVPSEISVASAQLLHSSCRGWEARLGRISKGP